MELSGSLTRFVDPGRVSPADAENCVPAATDSASPISIGELQCLEHGAAPGAWNMAVDEALLERARRGQVVVRFYSWTPACLSFGRNQIAKGRYDMEAIRRKGLQVVRRPTGGRAVHHDRELTYSVVAPCQALGSLKSSYERINRALCRGLARLGLPVNLASRSAAAPRPSLRACFRDPLPGEVTVDARKLVGSAQWRDGGVLLQHGSILLFDDQDLTRSLLLDPVGAGAGRVHAASLSEFLPGLPTQAELSATLRAGFADEFAVPVVDAQPDAELTDSARRLEVKYRSSEWTWRR